MREANIQWSSLANFLAAGQPRWTLALRNRLKFCRSLGPTRPWLRSYNVFVPPAKREELKLQSSGAGLLNCSRVAFFMCREWQELSFSSLIRPFHKGSGTSLDVFESCETGLCASFMRVTSHFWSSIQTSLVSFRWGLLTEVGCMVDVHASTKHHKNNGPIGIEPSQYGSTALFPRVFLW